MRHSFCFQDVADAIGEEAAAALVAEFGGLTLPVPAACHADPRGGCWDGLVRVIGEPAARKLVANCAGVRLSIPLRKKGQMQRRDAALQKRFDELTGPGEMSARKAVQALAREFFIVESTVWRALKRPAEEK